MQITETEENRLNELQNKNAYSHNTMTADELNEFQDLLDKWYDQGKYKPIMKFTYWIPKGKFLGHMRYRYNGNLFQFVNKISDSIWIDSVGFGPKCTPCWTRTTRDETRKMYPKAFKH